MPIRAGELRPSQAVTAAGPGALIDLPTLSMIVAGSDEWTLAKSRRVDEPRLANLLGVEGFRQPPFFDYKDGLGGIRARIFPTFLVCPRCNRLAHHPPFSGRDPKRDPFEFRERRSLFLCKGGDCQGKGNAVAYPVRFMAACPRGHIQDFPWHEYVHEPGTTCRAELRLEDSGRTGAITDLWVKCTEHPDAKKNLGQAFGQQGRRKLPRCRGLRPWLGDSDPKGCGEELRILLRGASNAYFPVVESAISIPPWSDPVQVELGQYFDQFAKVDSLEKLRSFREIVNMPELDGFTDDELWEAIRKRRTGEKGTIDLRTEEWKAFQAEPGAADARAQYRAESSPVPQEMTGVIGRVVRLERLREVRAIRGFTRIDPIPDIGLMDDVQAVEVHIAPIAKKRADWLPGVDYRGEGIFLQFDEDAVGSWESSTAVRELWHRFEEQQQAWFRARDLDFEGRVPKPPRYVLLHGIAHLLISRLALECGYASASLRERIYSAVGARSMAGILIYTATPDSEGSLGGLVDQGRPEFLGPMFKRALDHAELCANDPLCADREPVAGHDLNGAACHACLLISETSCEAGNQYLDRSLLVPTLCGGETAFANR